MLTGVAVGLSRNPRGAEVAHAFAGLLPPVVADGEADEEEL